MEKEIIQEKPITMYPIPRFDSIVIAKTFVNNYVMAPLEEKDLDYIYKEFAAMNELDTNSKPISNGFTIRIGKRVVSDDKIVMFGKSDEWDFAIENKLNSIITNNPLCIRVPIDKAKNLIGNRLNTGATIKMVHEYNVALIGTPKYIIIFKDGKSN